MSFAGFDDATRGSLEAQIANISDELAYNAHDLDDGLQADLFTPTELDELEIWRTLRDRLNWHGEVLDEIMRHHIIRDPGVGGDTGAAHPAFAQVRRVGASG